MPITVEQRKLITAEALALSDLAEDRIELIEGEIALMSAEGYEHNFIGFRFQKIFEKFSVDHPAWLPGFDNDMFLVERDPDTLLSPDASLFRRRSDIGATAWLEFSPEIAVEVLSPSNTTAQMTWKRHKYFKGGTEEVWLASPTERSLEVYYPDGRCVRLTGDEVYQCALLENRLEVKLIEIFARI